MMQIRRANDRGVTKIDWLDSRHTFSFGDYHDPQQMGFGALRVINEDRVRAGQGFGTHGHRDMEILTVVLEGALEHRDSLGNGSVIRPGDVQRMSAGTGVLHSEHNASQSEPVHFLQIWIVPEQLRIQPGYEQKSFPASERRNALRLLASRDARDGSLRVHQDVDLYGAVLEPGASQSHALRAGRRAWLQVVRGTLHIGSETLGAGDGAATHEEKLPLSAAGETAEFLLFDLA
jgi:quercetin 2,3-dioxygenase